MKLQPKNCRMLFTSMEFCLYFLPIAQVGFFMLGHIGGSRAASAWLLATSIVFYAWWNWRYVFLLAALTLICFWVSVWIDRWRRTGRDKAARRLLTAAIIFFLAVLGYYKYANFFLDQVAAVSGQAHAVLDITLPLGISFFTFQKIAYLVDSYKGRIDEHDAGRFALFVAFFPQLIAGPIVHHLELIPQMRRPAFGCWQPGPFTDGLVLFLLGIFKKAALADTCAPISDAVFGAAHQGVSLSFTESWMGTLAYTLQIYFDFSGYSDMAIGLGLMFGLVFPENFANPYRASSIIEFWRCWHMTLSRFLRDYIYIGLGGNRLGTTRRYANLLATMLLGGLWHGANWTFVVWGFLHGVFLVINHEWRHFLGERHEILAANLGYRIVARMLTFLCVVVAWVFFRAQTFTDAANILFGMAGLHSASALTNMMREELPKSVFGNTDSIEYWGSWILIGMGLGIVWFGYRLADLSTAARVALLVPTFGFVIQSVFFASKSVQFIYFQF